MPRALLASQSIVRNCAVAISATILSLCFGVNAEAQYQVTTSPRGMISIRNNGTSSVLIASGDDVTQNFAMPFDFRYFNQPITAGTNISVNTNGVIAMDPAVYSTSSTFSNTDLGVQNSHDGVVALFWDDLFCTSGTSAVLTEVIGSSPNQILVIEYNALRRFGGSNHTYTGQALFFEGTNIIEFRYDTSLAFENPSATLGIEDQTGLVAFGAPGTGSSVAVEPMNNFRFNPGNVVGIDLVADNSTPMLSVTNAAPGAMVDVTRTFTNNGSMPSGAHTVTYYLSTDATIETTDTVIGTQAITDTAAYGSDMGTQSVTIPAAQAPGNYFVGYIVDSAGAVTEVIENNNASLGTPFFVSAGPTDLSASSITTTATMITPGAQITYTRELANTSANLSAPFRVGVYLSTDNTITTMDTLIEDFTFTAGLAGGSNDNSTVTVTVPGSVATTGTFFLGMIVDFPDDVTETDENNNVVVAGGTLTSMAPPDVDVNPTLVDVVLNGPTSYAPGDMVDMDRVVRNLGTVASGSIVNRIVLSLDTTVDANDIVIFTETVAMIAANGSESGMVTGTVPMTAPAGVYNLILSGDADGVQPEVDETNNTTIGLNQITITGGQAASQTDLQPTQLTLSAQSGMVGDSIMITTSVINNGTGTVSVSDLVIVLSDDMTTDLSDPIVSSQTLVAVTGSSTVGPNTISFTIPNGTAPGTYFFGGIADSLNGEAETDENNNVIVSSAFTVDRSTGDINGDGRVSVADVQATVNQVLLLAPQDPISDLNGDSFFDILDVQRAVNLAMGNTP